MKKLGHKQIVLKMLVDAPYNRLTTKEIQVKFLKEYGLMPTNWRTRIAEAKKNWGVEYCPKLAQKMVYQLSLKGARNARVILFTVFNMPEYAPDGHYTSVTPKRVEVKKEEEAQSDFMF